MPSFGLITEGKTDQIVVGNILSGFFNDPDIDVRPFLPVLYQNKIGKYVNL